MNRKTFVLDTNVLLHDPEAIQKFKESNVVIPLGVLEELDGMKRQVDELGKNARQVIRYIDSLKNLGQGTLHEGVQIDNGSRIRIYMDAGIREKTVPSFFRSKSQ